MGERCAVPTRPLLRPALAALPRSARDCARSRAVSSVPKGASRLVQAALPVLLSARLGNASLPPLLPLLSPPSALRHCLGPRCRRPVLINQPGGQAGGCGAAAAVERLDALGVACRDSCPTRRALHLAASATCALLGALLLQCSIGRHCSSAVHLPLRASIPPAPPAASWRAASMPRRQRGRRAAPASSHAQASSSRCAPASIHCTLLLTLPDGNPPARALPSRRVSGSEEGRGNGNDPPRLEG